MITINLSFLNAICSESDQLSPLPEWLDDDAVKFRGDAHKKTGQIKNLLLHKFPQRARVNDCPRRHKVGIGTPVAADHHHYRGTFSI